MRLSLSMVATDLARIVVDLVAGSGLSFAARGEHTLKGVAGKWACSRSRVDAVGLLGDEIPWLQRAASRAVLSLLGRPS